MKYQYPKDKPFDPEEFIQKFNELCEAHNDLCLAHDELFDQFIQQSQLIDEMAGVVFPPVTEFDS